MMHYSAGSVAGIAAAGFNIADVSTVAALNALPEGMKGIVWTPNNPGNTASFRSFAQPFIGNPKLLAFRLADEPDPEGRFGKATITFAQMKAETDWLHSQGAKAFTVLMDLGSYEAPSLTRDGVPAYTPENTGLDYIGLDPYPIRGRAADINYIDRMFKAALAVGWKVEQIVPVYQAFGGGSYTTTTGGQSDTYVLPTVDQMNAMFALWQKLCPNPVFDMAWTYETKSGITSIASTTTAALALREAFKAHNTAVVVAPVPLMLNGQPATQEGIDALTASAAQSAALLEQVKTLLKSLLA